MKIDVDFDKAKLKKMDDRIKGSIPDITREAIKVITNSGRNEVIKALDKTVYGDTARSMFNKRHYERGPTGMLKKSITARITQDAGLVYIPASEVSVDENGKERTRVVDYAYYLETGKGGIMPRNFFALARQEIKKQLRPTVQRVLIKVLRKARLI